MNELKTPVLNNPETYVITHNRFNTYMVLIFDDLKKAQISKMPYKNSPHQEIEKVLIICMCSGRMKVTEMRIFYLKLRIKNIFI